MRNLWNFLKAVCSQWVTLVTGSVVIVVLAVWERMTGSPISWNLYLIILVLAVFWAGYRVWRDEHERFLVEQRKNARPELKGEIQELYAERDFGGLPAECDCAVVLKLYVVNHSPAPVSIRNYKLRVTTNNEVRESASPVGASYWQLVREEVHRSNFGFISKRFVYEDLPDLKVRIGNRSLVQGQAEEGWLGFLLNGISPTELEGGAITVTIVDAYGGEHLISSTGPWSKSGQLIERGWLNQLSS